MTPVKSFGFFERVATFAQLSTPVHSPELAILAQRKPLKTNGTSEILTGFYSLYDYDSEGRLALDEEKTVVGNVEKQLLGRRGAPQDLARMSERDYEALLIRQAERAAARLRAEALARRGVGAAAAPDATDAPGTPKKA